MIRRSLLCAAVVLLCGAASVSAQEDKITQGLAMQPVQKQVKISTPTGADVAKCKIENISMGNTKGIRIVDGNGLTLREFLDTNGDGAVDQWRYFNDGLEVYRDIDENGNKKADNYRWYNTSGTRWGVDDDEDGIIDSWKVLSVQELTSEIIGALASGDEERFSRVLLSAQELKDLGLGDEKYKLIVEKLRAANEKFNAIADTKPLAQDATWVQFSGAYPSTFSQGTEGSTADVDYYENTTCVASSEGKDVEIAVGTLLRVGSVWKALDCPSIVTADNANDLAANNVFIRVNAGSNGAAGAATASPLDAELTKLDERINAAGSSQELEALHKERADLLEKGIQESSGEERSQRIHNLVDGILGAVQMNVFPDGLERLQKLFDSLKDNEEDKQLAAYVKFRLMSCEYTQGMSKPGSASTWMQTRAKWLESLSSFIEAYPDAPDAAEAMLQLAMETENDGMDEKASGLYSQIMEKFPDSPSAAKATGAYTRLNCVGKPLAFVAPVFGQEGKQVNIANLKNRVVVLNFWASWMNNVQKELETLRALQAKYGNKELVVLGVSMDLNADDLKKAIAANQINWFQLYEEGGMDSRLANSLGIFNIPTTFVIGKDGNVVSRNAMVADLDEILKGMGMTPAPAAPAAQTPAKAPTTQAPAKTPVKAQAQPATRQPAARPNTRPAPKR